MIADPIPLVAAREAILATLRTILVDELAIRLPVEALDPDVLLFGGGVGLDSVDGIELAFAIEREFAVEIPQDDRFPTIMRSLNSVVDHVLASRAPREREPAPAAAHVAQRTDGYRALRSTVARVDTAHLALIEVRSRRGSIDEVIDALDRALPSDLFLYDGQARAALLLDVDGLVVADLTLARVEGRMFVIGEETTAQALGERLAESADVVEVVDLRPHTTSVALHGPFAWELVGEWLGRSVSVLPPLGVCALPDGVVVVRGGRTGEYGFEVLLAEGSRASRLAKLDELMPRFDGALLSVDELAAATVESGGFSIRALGPAHASPIELQLGFRLSPKKRSASLDAVAARRARFHRRTVLFTSSREVVGALRVPDGPVVGHVVYGRARDDAFFGVALVDATLAHPGLSLVDGHGTELHTRSAPLVRPRSLDVRPHVDRYRSA